MKLKFPGGSALEPYYFLLNVALIVWFPFTLEKVYDLTAPTETPFTFTS